LPTVVTLSDSDAMIPGRVPSAFAELEIIARVSMSGDPIAKTGDWFGSLTHRNGSNDPLAILIDQQVP
jgi:cytochrome c-type biogenesis protein CcmH